MKRLVGYDEARARSKPTEKKRVAKVNTKRDGHRFPENVCGPLRVFLRGLPCILTGRANRDGELHRCNGPVVVCHLKTRGSGAPDLENCFPGCMYGAHADQEGNTKEFEYTWTLRLKIECRRYTSLFYDTISGKRWKSGLLAGRAANPSECVTLDGTS